MNHCVSPFFYSTIVLIFCGLRQGHRAELGIHRGGHVC